MSPETRRSTWRANCSARSKTILRSYSSYLYIARSPSVRPTDLHGRPRAANALARGERVDEAALLHLHGEGVGICDNRLLGLGARARFGVAAFPGQHGR